MRYKARFLFCPCVYDDETGEVSVDGKFHSFVTFNIARFLQLFIDWGHLILGHDVDGFPIEVSNIPAGKEKS